MPFVSKEFENYPGVSVLPVEILVPMLTGDSEHQSVSVKNADVEQNGLWMQLQFAAY